MFVLDKDALAQNISEGLPRFLLRNRDSHALIICILNTLNGNCYNVMGEYLVTI